MVIDIKITLYIPFNPAIPFLLIVPHMYKDYCMPRLLIAVLIIIAKDWKQPKYPSTGDWLEEEKKKMILHSGNRILCSSSERT